MKTHFRILFTLIFFTTLFSSCLFVDTSIFGDGIVVEEFRDVQSFDKILSAGSFAVYYENADEYSVTVVAESNLLPYIETNVVGKELRIRTSSGVNLRSTKAVEVYVRGNYLEGITLSGSGSITTETINAEDLDVDITGSGDVDIAFVGSNLSSKISGSGKMNVYAECRNVDFKISGSGRIYLDGFSDYSDYKISGSGRVNAYDFWVDEADVDISGSGNVYLNVAEDLEGTISGSGKVYYIGNPRMNVRVSGSGRVVNDN